MGKATGCTAEKIVNSILTHNILLSVNFEISDIAHNYLDIRSKQCSSSYIPFSAVITPCLIKKSITTGQLVVLKSLENTFSKHLLAGKSSNACTSPSELVGTKSGGSSRSNTNSVFGKMPRSLSNRNETHPADTKFFTNVSGIEASSAASLIAVSSMPYPTDSPPPTILSHFPGHVCFVSERC